MQGRELSGKEDLKWNTDVVETMMLEKLTWIQQETVEMPQLRLLDEVFEVLEPLRW